MRHHDSDIACLIHHSRDIQCLFLSNQKCLLWERVPGTLQTGKNENSRIIALDYSLPVTRGLRMSLSLGSQPMNLKGSDLRIVDVY
jgi:hypothetical protein